MTKKPRIGSDPLRWIKDTATPPNSEPVETSPRELPEALPEEEEGVLGTVPRIEESVAPVVPEEPVPSKPGRVSKPGKTSKLSKPETPPESISTSRMGLAEDWTRATVIARIEYLEKIKALAYFDRRQLKDVIDEVFAGYLKGRASDLKEAEALYKRRRTT